MGPTRPGGASNSTSDVGTGMGTAYDMQGPTSPGSLSSSAPIGAADGVDRSRCSAAGATGDSTRGADDSRALGRDSPPPPEDASTISGAGGAHNAYSTDKVTFPVTVANTCGQYARQHFQYRQTRRLHSTLK